MPQLAQVDEKMNLTSAKQEGTSQTVSQPSGKNNILIMRQPMAFRPYY